MSNILNINDPPTAINFDFTNMQTVDFLEFINDIDEDILSIRTIPPSEDDNLMTVFGNQFLYTGSEYIYNYTSPGNDFDVLLYKVDDGLSVSNVATAIYDISGEGFNRDAPSALDDEINIEEDNVH